MSPPTPKDSLAPAVPRVDIYADGALLGASRNNPAKTAGCGVVIVEGGGKRSFGRVSESQTVQACELEALVLALRSVQENEWQKNPKPTITLYTDQKSLTEITKYTRRPRNEEVALQRDEALKLSKEMRVNIEYMKHNKFTHESQLLPEIKASIEHMVHHKFARRSAVHNAYFSEADQLAGTIAWQERLKQQGYIHSLERGRLEGEEARKMLDAQLPRDDTNRAR